jgi:DNA-binding winged helix-turn-helix (wHTH) protein
MSWGKLSGQLWQKGACHGDSGLHWEGVVSFERAEGKREGSIRFDLFELNAGSAQLRRRGLPVDLPPQALRVLVMLAGRPDELVTRKEIKEALWPGQSYGDFDSRLNFAVRKLREALGDDAEQPRYVQTVRNAGYRFIAPVREPRLFSAALPDLVDHSMSSGSGPLTESAQKTLVAGNGLLLRSNRLLAFVTFVVVAVAVAGVFMLRQHGPARPTGSYVSAAVGVTKVGDGLHVLSVSAIIPEVRQRIVIKGTGFGLHVPYAHTDSPYLAIRDLTANWSAGRLIAQNWDEVTVDVESWTDTEIVVSGFGGDYGLKGWKLTAGDDVEVAVWNPQSGVGPSLFHVTVTAANASQ